MTALLETEALLRRRLWRIVVLPLAAGSIGVAIAILYGTFTLPLDAANPVRVGLLALLGAFVGIGYYLVRAYLEVPALRAAAAAQHREPELLRRAVAELFTFPDRAFTHAAWGWGVAALAGMLFAGLFSQEPGWAPMLRIGLGALWCAPMSALLIHLTSSLQTRAGIKELAELGLAAKDVADCAPPRRNQLRVRLVAFTAICVISPASLTADLASAASKNVIVQVSRVEGAVAKRLLADRLHSEAVAQVGGTAALMLLLAIATAYAAGAVVGRPMREIAEEATRIARGHLSSGRTIPADDEVWAVSAAFAAVQAHLGRVLAELKRAGVEIGSATEEIVDTSTRYEEGATEQATALNETSATTEELARSARQIADNATSVAEIAQRTLAAANEGQMGAESFSRAMARMEHDNRAIASAVVKLNKRVQQIGRIVEFINGVADKSDLLALNAELEGTKAGEVGRGFSLVAAEMRRLAENVLESTKEIEGLIEEIREATSGAVTATTAGLQATELGSAHAREVRQRLEEIVQLAGRTSDAVRSISLATQQQQTGTDQLAEAMADILRVTQQSLAATKQVSAANVDLAALSLELKAVVSRFRVGERA